MTFTEPVVTKLILAQQYIGKSIYTHFNANPINGLVADILRHRQINWETKDQRTWLFNLKRYLYFLRNLKEPSSIYKVMPSSCVPSL